MTKRALVRALEAKGFKCIENEDTAPNQVRISCEEYGDIIPGNYYDVGMLPEDWKFGINPIIHELAEKAGSYCEWENPAVISIYL